MRFKQPILILLTVFLFTCHQPAFAGYKNEAHWYESSGGYNEKYYQKTWCNAQKGRMEVVLPDKTRCDCLTETHAIEFDFAKKWMEAVGQSLHYSRYTRKKAGIVIICRHPADSVKLISLRELIKFYSLPIDIWDINCEKIDIAKDGWRVFSG